MVTYPAELSAGAHSLAAHGACSPRLASVFRRSLAAAAATGGAGTIARPVRYLFAASGPVLPAHV
jgi:hypothetical protein